jgi:transposase
MIPEPIRQSVHTLLAQGHSLRTVSRLLKLSRNSVRRIVRGGPAHGEAPAPYSEATLAALRQAMARAQGNASRALQLLAAEQGLELSYSTLTRWIRQAQIREPPVRAGEYVFGPGEEMQHDTSPHRVTVGGRALTAQCAGLVLACSRRLFIQYYPRFTRFEAKQFLLEAARFMDGTARTCVIDNTSVLVASGAGADAVFAPELVAFARTLGFGFQAHRIGHPDRKARIERPFYFVETNFLPGRTFADFADLNRQAAAWCREVANAKPKRALGMSAEAAYLIEKPYLVPLPEALPPVYEVLDRVVDLHGFVSVDTNRYSVPERLIGQAVTVYKYPEEIHVQHRGTPVANHRRLVGQRDMRHVVAEHHRQPKRADRVPALEERLLLAAEEPVLARYAERLRHRPRGHGLRALKRLLELQRTYPKEPFLAAVAQALEFGLFDLGRLETLILRHVVGDFFALNSEEPDADA